MLIAGISAFYHESACSLLSDGVPVAAAAEERFSRVKHDAALPVEAFRFCLRSAGADLTDLDAVAYYERPVDKLSRQIWSGRPTDPAALDPTLPERAIRRRLGWDGPLLTFPHHLSHAASAYFCSGFPDAAVLTADGVGEWATTTYGRGRGGDLELFAGVDFPHSLGLLYSTLTAWLGFRVNSDEYKVMGLAPHGAPRHLDRLRRLLHDRPGGGFELDPAYFDFVTGERMFSPALSDLLGAPPRRPGDDLTPFHADVAASLQRLLEETLLRKVRWLAGQVASENLCMAGGVALNCVANGVIRRRGPFRRLFVQPAAGDAGGSLGAALLAHRQLTGGTPGGPLDHVHLGPAFGSDRIAATLTACNLEHADHRGDETALLRDAADRLAAGQVIGWFHGAMEFGPRALGARSILADPRDPAMRDRVNARIKKRESFRPFAPAVLLDAAHRHFDLDHPSPFMLETCAVRTPELLPAVTHVDGSARPQTVDPATHPRFAALLRVFAERSGVPLLLNTSFNVAGEPIVCSPSDALLTFARAGLDALVLEDHVVDRSALPADLGDLVPLWRADRHRPHHPGLPTDLYTFV